MSDDPRLVLWCRLGLLFGSLLHWFGISMFLWQKAGEVVRTAAVFSNRC